MIHVEFRSFFERQCYNINARLKRLGENGIKPGRLPSVGAAPLMIAGIIATEVVNLITGKTPPLAVPSNIQYDVLLRKFRRRTYPMGMRGPLQALKKAILRKNCPCKGA
jgi:hypothetical protein